MSENGMPVPTWVKDAREQMIEAHQDAEIDTARAKPVELEPVLNFSTLFAEWELKENDLLVHLFPRSGGDDSWYPSYLSDRGEYRPGRREIEPPVRFPDRIKDIIKAAVDVVWQGSAAISDAVILRYGANADIEEDEPDEFDLGAFAIQFQDAKETVVLAGTSKFVDTFCAAVDEQLEQ